MKKRQRQKPNRFKLFLKTQKGRSFILAFTLVIFVGVATFSIISIIRSQHSAETFVQKYQHIDQSKFRNK